MKNLNLEQKLELFRNANWQKHQLTSYGRQVLNTINTIQTLEDRGVIPVLDDLDFLKTEWHLVLEWIDNKYGKTIYPKPEYFITEDNIETFVELYKLEMFEKVSKTDRQKLREATQLLFGKLSEADEALL